jgi:hypothetical protein
MPHDIDLFKEEIILPHVISFSASNKTIRELDVHTDVGFYFPYNEKFNFRHSICLSWQNWREQRKNLWKFVDLFFLLLFAFVLFYIFCPSHILSWWRSEVPGPSREKKGNQNFLITVSTKQDLLSLHDLQIEYSKGHPKVKIHSKLTWLNMI